MKVQIINRTGFNQFVDLDGNDKTDDIVIIGPKGRVIVEIPNEQRFLEISKQFRNKLILRKI